MAQDYTRQSTFADGDTITAALFNDEYNQLVNAFAYSSTSENTTGHRHDGTSGQGGSIPKIGDLDFLNKIEVDSTNNRWGFYVEVSSAAVEQIRVQDGAIVPVTDNDIDLGSSSLEFKDLYIDGTATIDTLVVDEAITVGTTLGVTDATTLSSTLGVTGATTLSSTLDVTGATTLSSTLAVTGTSTLTGNVTTTNDLSVGGNLTVTGNATISGNLTFGDADTDSITLTADVASNITPDTDDTYDLGSSTKKWRDIYIDGTAYLDAINFNGIAITATAAELNILDGVTATATELNILDGVTSTTAELNILNGVTSTATELNILDGVTATTTELNVIDGDTAATSTTLADADRVVVNDAGVMKQVALTDFETYFESAIDTISGNLTITGDLTINGDDLIMATNTAGHLLIADGTNFNPTAVGDLSEITSVAGDDVLLAVDTSGGGLKKIQRSTLVAGLAASNALSNIVEDTTPQLGGDLDVNGQDIVSVSNGNITITPNGTGLVRLDGNVDIQSGEIVLKNSGSLSNIKFYCEVTNAHYTQLQSSPHSAYSGNVILTLPATTDTLVGKTTTDTLTNKTLTAPTMTGIVTISSTDALTLPVGTTAQRPTAVQGMLRFNTTASQFEGYDGSEWGIIGGADFAYTRTTATATASQTTFSATYTVGYVDVYLNGVKLVVGTDFTATDGTSVVLTTGATVGDNVEIIAYESFNIANALVAANNLSDLSSASTARTNLGLAIGTDVQAYDAQLADVAGLTPTDGNFIVGDGTNFVTESGATAIASLGITSTAAEINYLDITTLGSSEASKAVTADSNAKVKFIGTTSVAEMIEKVDIPTSTTGTINFDFLSQAVQFYNTNQTANRTINFRGDSSNSLDSIMAVGESMTAAVLMKQGTTAYYLNTYQIDGSAVTPEWSNGDAPSSGNTSSIDSYVFTIIKTASATFTVLASQSQYA